MHIEICLFYEKMCKKMLMVYKMTKNIKIYNNSVLKDIHIGINVMKSRICGLCIGESYMIKKLSVKK